MKKISILALLICLLPITQGCEDTKRDLSASERKVVIEDAKKTVQKVFESSNNHQFLEGLHYYSGDSDAYYTSNGEVFTLEELKKSYREIAPSVEVLENSIDTWNATFLSANTIAFTLPLHLKMKLVGVPEYNGQLVWTGIVQKRDKQWKIVQSHESWLNCVEVAAAFTPIPSENE
ncbi:nuclear transport factor 2 family protein [Lutimonas sp.]|uniref:nuclear transport factor 2 family protein n=1 Tax=Lutimonas sp. TaxID=1872403 RepID=UPI003D9BA483